MSKSRSIIRLNDSNHYYSAVGVRGDVSRSKSVITSPKFVGTTRYFYTKKTTGDVLRLIKSMCLRVIHTEDDVDQCVIHIAEFTSITHVAQYCFAELALCQVSL